LVYGSGWKQRYFKKVGDDYFPFPAQWDITHKVWRPYMVANGTDWWATLYPRTISSARPDALRRLSFGELQHRDQAVTEWNFGCERCHGAGSDHVAQKTRASILNPARRTMSAPTTHALQCHSQGQPLKNPIAGKYYDWPVGYHVGLNCRISGNWKSTSSENQLHPLPDGTAHKNRMQGNDYVQSLMCARVTAFRATIPMGPEKTRSSAAGQRGVLTCHGRTHRRARTPLYRAHTHHKTAALQRLRCLPHAQDRAENRRC